jgi:hypothetical protein
MNSLNVIRIDTWTPSVRVSSGRHPVTTVIGLNAVSEEFVTTDVMASSARVSLDRVAPPRLLSTRSRRSLWFTVLPALSIGGLAATPGLAVKPGQAGDGNRSDAAGDAAAETPPAAISAKPPSAISRVELTIDSLPTYDLIRPIPVVVESLGERNYVAEMPDLNISTSASNPSDILITLKDRIAQVYDGLRIMKFLDAEQSRQLKVLESYIVKSRRGWLDRR